MRNKKSNLIDKIVNFFKDIFGIKRKRKRKRRKKKVLKKVNIRQKAKAHSRGISRRSAQGKDPYFNV